MRDVQPAQLIGYTDYFLQQGPKAIPHGFALKTWIWSPEWIKYVTEALRPLPLGGSSPRTLTQLTRATLSA